MTFLDALRSFETADAKYEGSDPDTPGGQEVFRTRHKALMALMASAPGTIAEVRALMRVVLGELHESLVGGDTSDGIEMALTRCLEAMEQVAGGNDLTRPN